MRKQSLICFCTKRSQNRPLRKQTTPSSLSAAREGEVVGDVVWQLLCNRIRSRVRISILSWLPSFCVVLVGVLTI